MDLKTPDLTNNTQKAIAGVALVGLLMLLWFLLPPLVTILKNLWIAAILGGGLCFLIYNYELIWNIFKKASWELTKKHISSNKLWYMWQGYRYLVSQNDALNNSIIEVGAIKTETQKALSNLASKAQAAKEEHIRESKKSTSQVFLKVIQNKVALYDQQFKTLEPKLQFINTQYSELVKLHENWVADAEIVNQTLTAKEQEYELMKSLSKASDSAGAFLKRDSPEMKNFNESLKQIDKSIFTYTSNVENFQRTVLPTLRSMDSQREANEEEGLKIIEEYKKQRIAI